MTMTELLREQWPVLVAQIETALRSAGEPTLARHLYELQVVKRCVCQDDFCQSFYTSAPPEGPYGTGHRNVALGAPWPGRLIMDVVDEKIMYVEVLYRSPLD